MSQAQARAWWADVEHLREVTERRRSAHPHAHTGEVVALAPDWRQAAAQHFDELAGRTTRERHVSEEPAESPRRAATAVALEVPARVATLLRREPGLDSATRDDVGNVFELSDRWAVDEPAVDVSTPAEVHFEPEVEPAEELGFEQRRFERRPEPPADEAEVVDLPRPRRFAREDRAERAEPRPRRFERDEHADRGARRRERIRSHATAPAAPRRTVEITGQAPVPHIPEVTARRSRAAAEVAEPPVVVRRPRRASMHPLERLAHRPDRLALWAFILGVVLVIVAAASAHS